MQLLKAGWRDFWAIWLLQNAAFGRDAWDPVELGWQLLTAPVRLKAVEDGLVQGYVFGERRDREQKDASRRRKEIHPRSPSSRARDAHSASFIR